MDVTKILEELRQEREQLEEAILSLERLARGRGRRAVGRRRGWWRQKSAAAPWAVRTRRLQPNQAARRKSRRPRHRSGFRDSGQIHRSGARRGADPVLYFRAAKEGVLLVDQISGGEYRETPGCRRRPPEAGPRRFRARERRAVHCRSKAGWF